MSRIYLVLVMLVSITLLMSHSDNPPNGKTGAPGDGLCTDCHSLGTGTQDGSITVTGMPATIQPSTMYVLTVTNSNPNGVAAEAGFQLTILNSSNQKAGLMTNPSSSSVVTPSGGREYWEHNPSVVYPGNNIVTWTVTWTSPVGPPGNTITAYVAGNVADGNNDDNNDLIVTSTGTGMMAAGVPLEVDIISSTDVACNGANTGSATAGATGGTSPYSYHWSNNVNQATINNVPAGTYTVTVTDQATSTATTSVVISQPAAIVLQAPVISNVSCFGGANGSIQAGASGGTPPLSYNWSNGGTGTTITGLAAGTYTLTVTDDNNCTKTANYQVTQPPQININLISLSDETCSGAEDGAITISITGGANPIFAEWSNGFIGTTITDLAPDTYSVTVTDNNDCQETATYVIHEGGVVVVTLQQQQNVTCNGGNNGSLSVLAAGGEAPYTYSWSNGGSGASITNLTAGNYLVTATDNNGCNVVKLYTITQPAPINIQVNSTGQNLCAGDSLVDLTAIPTGPQPPFSGLWSNGVQGLTNNNLSAGTYTITVTDDTGCTASTAATVTAPLPLLVSVATTDETSSGANDGTALAVVTGGTPGVTFLWSNTSTENPISGLAPGTYTVTITDSNGCTATASGQVDAFGCALDVSLGADILICESDTILLTPQVTGASDPVSYLWSNGANSQSIEVFTGGEFCVTVTDNANCQDVDCIIITQDTFPLITCPVTDESAPGQNDGAISCDSISGSISYLWSTGATTPGITGLAPGTYCVTMTNTHGCTAEQCFTVQAGNCQLVVTSLIAGVQCNGDSTGSISVNVENSTPPVTFIWSNGDTTATVDQLSAGEYTVSISDGAGCFETHTYVITQPDALNINVDSVENLTDIIPSGAISITVNGGTLPYIYQWTFPDGSIVFQEDLAPLPSVGQYTLLVTDGNQCTSTTTVQVDLDVAVDPGPVFKPLKVYPVPTSDVLHVELESQVTEALIMGIDGRLNKRILNPASNNLQVGELEPGWYIIRITDGQSWYIARMVK
ncbi:MAG: T9SS type A sorting domain-containing protein [Saprospiraceae bacterium]|nr:T9SS type A sorting domain-containing protein [Candidatus Opimibacter iunctus]